MFRDHSHIGSPKILDSIVEPIQSVCMCIKKTRKHIRKLKSSIDTLYHSAWAITMVTFDVPKPITHWYRV